jgi:hypothetical protein
MYIRSQPIDLLIYIYNASVVVVFRSTYVEEKNVFRTHKATRGVVNFYSADVVTRDRRMGPRSQSYDF